MSDGAPDDLGDLIADWPGTHALAVGDASRLAGAAGDLDLVHPVASVTKLFSCFAVLVAVEEGSVDLDEAAGPAGSTVRHLMAHASGLAFDEHRVLAEPGERRIYSNVGIEVLATHVAERTGMTFAEYLHLGVLEPLGLGHVDTDVAPSAGLYLSVRSMMRFGQELLAPTLIDRSTLAMATSPVFPELRGVLPGFGPMHPNPWGLGFEIKAGKDPHWTAPHHAPTTFGHFGGAGSFLWVDPERGLTGATAGDTPFGEWAARAWAPTNQRLLDRYSP